MLITPLALVGFLAVPVSPALPVVQDSLFWTQEAKLISSAPSVAGHHGEAVAIWGDTLLVGEPFGGPSSSGRVHIYVHDGVSWNHQALLQASDPTDTRFGRSVAYEESTALIGTGSDSAYIFQRSGSLWFEVAELTDNSVNPPSFREFGAAVALSGDLALVGAPDESPSNAFESGSVYAFQRTGLVWSLHSKLIPPGTEKRNQFGSALAISGTTLLVGDQFDDDQGDDAGAVYIYEWGGSSWTETKKLFASDGESLGKFGTELALFDDTLVASGLHSVPVPGGTVLEQIVYVFERDSGGPETWGEVMQLSTGDPEVSGGFGSALALLGDRLLAGAFTVRGEQVGGIQGLAFDSNSVTLYGTDIEQDVLVSIDSATGAATIIGDLGFGAVRGLAFDAATNTLYGIDTKSEQLITIDPITGAGTAAGGALGFPGAIALAFDSNTRTLYTATRGFDELLSIDTTTGAATVIGSLALPLAGQELSGLAFDAGTGILFGSRAGVTSAETHVLVSIDRATGATTEVGDMGLQKVYGFGHIPGLGFAGALDFTDEFATLDDVTGVGTKVGPFSTYEPAIGAVFVHQRDEGGSGAWGQVAKITDPQGEGLDFFGLTSLGLWGDRIFVSAWGDDDADLDAGAAHVLQLSVSAATYCTAGTSAAGCQAVLQGTGSPSAVASSGFHVTAAGVEGQKNGILFFGVNGRQSNPWGNGTSMNCVIPPVTRAGLLAGSGTTGACDGAFTQDLNALWCPTCPKPNANPGAGATVQAQLWYRDPQNSSNQTTSLSDALEFPVGP